MSSYRAIPLEDRSAWRSALESIPHAYAHSWEGCQAFALTWGSPTYLWSAEHGQGRFACVFAERLYGEYVDVVTPYGLPGFVGSSPWGGLAGLWRRFATERGYVCAYLVLNPVLSDPSYFAGTAKRHRTVYVVDLGLSEEELYARLPSNRKYDIRRSRESTGTIVRDQRRLAEFFVSTYPSFMARRRAAPVYALTPQALRSLCGSKHTFLVGTQRSGTVRAAALFGYSPYLGDYLFSVSEEGERGHSALLVWEGALELRRRGVPFLHLGGGVVEGDGVEAFKRRFGATPSSIMSAEEVYREDVYRDLCAEAGVDPDGDAGYFPAYRSPALVTHA
jgi:hypothetical protein